MPMTIQEIQAAQKLLMEGTCPGCKELINDHADSIEGLRTTKGNCSLLKSEVHRYYTPH